MRWINSLKKYSCFVDLLCDSIAYMPAGSACIRYVYTYL